MSKIDVSGKWRTVMNLYKANGTSVPAHCETTIVNRYLLGMALFNESSEDLMKYCHMTPEQAEKTLVGATKTKLSPHEKRKCLYIMFENSKEKSLEDMIALLFLEAKRVNAPSAQLSKIQIIAKQYKDGKPVDKLLNAFEKNRPIMKYLK